MLARWQEFAGTGDLLRSLEIRKGRQEKRRSRRHAAIPARTKALKSALRSSIEALAASLADRAAEDAMERWQSSPPGAGLLERAQDAHEAGTSADGAKPAYSSLRRWEGELTWGFPGGQAELAAALPSGGTEALTRSGDDLAVRAGRAVAAWQDHLLRLVQTENITKRSIARVATFDPEALALVLTIGVLGYGASDLVVSEGASAVPQQLLTSLFGAGLMRDIGGQARQDLHERIGVLYTEEALRFTALVDAVGALDDGLSADLYQASYALESAR